MKKFFIVAAMLLSVNCAFAQSVNREGNNFTMVKEVKQPDTKTVYTYTIGDEVYPIYISRNGRCYIIRTSKNGKEYRQYLGEEISRQICSELGVTYVEKIQK